MLNSALYSGIIRHRRHAPRKHAFRYRISMLWLDLQEQSQVFGMSGLWSGRWWSPMRFRERDYLSMHRREGEQLADTARRLVSEELSLTLAGPVRMLTQVRSFGMLFNPVSFYYCHDNDDQLRAIIAEVSNTPWRERFCYVMATDPAQAAQQFELSKAFHVSPFLPPELSYRMRFTRPGETLLVHMEDWQADSRLFDATLTLNRRSLNPKMLRNEALSFPFMVAKTVTGIYWQALRLALKRIPFFHHHAPRQNTVGTTAVQAKEHYDEEHQA
ncbi:DUF1365 domain-containing protein [uncultured Halopseudomonas sp.]|uniref:DUF1365 domain-containing protein n=1 Tax=uncultured Halopseudomonas sp. TaxID=2901193 RepID=UPI0030ED9A59|tara:strand:+ start:117722 stop:118537 length:816 start_codon:yes stop_codon:yes gene_type:complete